MVRLATEPPKRPADCILFHAANVVATPGVLALGVPAETLRGLVVRHYHGDWGACGAKDTRENEFALLRPLRLWSVFIVPTTTEMVWVITEADRSITTILLPDEY